MKIMMILLLRMIWHFWIQRWKNNFITFIKGLILLRQLGLDPLIFRSGKAKKCAFKSSFSNSEWNLKKKLFSKEKITRTASKQSSFPAPAALGILNI